MAEETTNRFEIYRTSLGTIVLCCIALVVVCAQRAPQTSTSTASESQEAATSPSPSELVSQTGHSGPVHSVAFSPDGKTLASGSEDHTVNLWEVSTGKLLRTLEGHSDVVNSVAFSPDGKTLASAMLGNVWELCGDRWNHNYESAPTDGSTWIKGGDGGGRAVRGGSRVDNKYDVGSARRMISAPPSGGPFAGVRLVAVARTATTRPQR